MMTCFLVLLLMVCVGLNASMLDETCGDELQAPKIQELVDRIVLRIDGQHRNWGGHRSTETAVGRYLDQLISFGFLSKNDFMGVSPALTHRGVPYFYDLTLEEIERLTKDLTFRSRLATALLRKASSNEDFRALGFAGFDYESVTDEVFAEDLRSAARTILATVEINTFSEQAYLTDSDFCRIADCENLAITWIPEGFRFDSRPPELIARDGFLPNPAKPLGSLSAHFSPTSLGARFVSLSKKANNEIALNSISIAKIAPHVESDNEHAERFSRLKALAISKDWLAPAEVPRLGVIYEYRAINLKGVEPALNTGFCGEEEFIVPYVPRRLVTQYRIVFPLIGRRLMKPKLGSPYASSGAIVLTHESMPWERLE